MPCTVITTGQMHLIAVFERSRQRAALQGKGKDAGIRHNAKQTHAKADARKRRD